MSASDVEVYYVLGIKQINFLFVLIPALLVRFQLLVLMFTFDSKFLLFILQKFPLNFQAVSLALEQILESEEEFVHKGRKRTTFSLLEIA